MSSRATLDPAVVQTERESYPSTLPVAVGPPSVHSWEAGEFAREQLLGMVRRVFLSGRAKPVRYVALAAIDKETETGSLCLQLASSLAGQLAGTVCVAASDPHADDLAQLAGVRLPALIAWRNGERLLRSASSQISSNLWLAPLQVLRGDAADSTSSLWLESKVADLRMEFDYAVIQAPAAGYSDAALLGRLSDGAVLVVEAGRTRRVAAQTAKDNFVAAGVRVLGTVLTERTFPIPQGIYKRL